MEVRQASTQVTLAPGSKERAGRGPARTAVSDSKAKIKKAERGRLRQRRIAFLRRPHDGCIQQINCNNCEVAMKSINWRARGRWCAI